MASRIHIFGPAGAGSTTLGAELAKTSSIPHWDADEFYWLREMDGTLYKRKRNPDHRRQLLEEKLNESESSILTGSVCGWGDIFIPRFTLVVYLYADKEIRLERIREREKVRYGENRINEGGDLHNVYQKFLKWVGDYDEGGMEMKSKLNEEEWMKKISCPLMRLDGNSSIEESVGVILKKLERLQR